MSSLFLLLLLLCFTLGYNVGEARHLNNKLPFPLVVGTVYCDTCFHQHFSNFNHFISGALVAVECRDSTASKPIFREEVKTDYKGEFKVGLPFSISKHVKKIEGCSVKLIRSSQPYCAVAASAAATSSSLHLKSKRRGKHIFSAGFFTFRPLNQPQFCNQKPRIKNNSNSLTSLIQDLSSTLALPPSGSANELSNEKTFGFPFPPNPLNPPSLFPPNPLNPPSLFPPNPFAPPPTILPPLPFQPPPSLIPPIFPSPNPPSLFPPVSSFPPIPGLIPSSPPPPPPSLLPPFPHLPPFPFQPAPGFPGVPPADSTSTTTNKPSPLLH